MTGAPRAMPALRELLAIMRRLRAADGCPWDRAQTFASIAPYAIEEAYEVADAAQRGDVAHLQDELGDLLFQVVFHAQIAEEAGHFDFDAVAAAIGEKLLRRHPQVFGGAAPGDRRTSWEDIKALERDAAVGPGGALEGVPRAMPALLRACKLSKRAARVGFDFEHAEQTADKVAEELIEVREAARNQARLRGGTTAGSAPIGSALTGSGEEPSPELVEELGDLLFAAANLARKLNVDAEAALRAANEKFERRFAGMEALAKESGERFSALGLAAQECLWQAVKRNE